MGFSGNGARPNANQVMVIITDGESNDEPQTMAQAKEAKESGKRKWLLMRRFAVVSIVAIFKTHSLNQTTQFEASQTKLFVFLNKFPIFLSGIHIVSVGIGNWLDLYELEMMASYPTERNMIRVQNFDSLNTIVDTIRDAACDSKCFTRKI